MSTEMIETEIVEAAANPVARIQLMHSVGISLNELLLAMNEKFAVAKYGSQVW